LKPRRLLPIARRSLLAFVLLGVASAQTATPPPWSSTAREIFELSGQRPQLEAFGLQLDQLVSAQQGFAPDVLDAIRTIIAKHYAVGALEAAIVPRIRDRENPKLAATALAWLRSDTGRSITALEEAAATAEAGMAIQLYVEELRQQPASPERVQLADRLNAVTHYDEARTDLGLSMIETLVLSLDATQSPELRADPVEVRRKIVSTRADALVEGKEMWRAAVLYTYRSLPISELEKFLGFADSAAGRWYYETIWKSSQETLDALSTKTHAAVVAAIAHPAPPGAP
jgi:hypothetical protein